jgi:serine phosphatase RsbU (regulator of sigma subunit)/predicted transcriptional regulator
MDIMITEIVPDRPHIARSEDSELGRALRVAKGILQQRAWRRGVRENTIFSAFEVGKLARIDVDWISSDTSLKTVDELIHDFGIDFFPVRQSGEFIGYVKREKFRALLGQNQYSRNILLRHENTVSDVLDTGLVTVDARKTLPEVSRLLMARPRDQLYDPFVITYHGEYLGIATVKAVMDGIAFYEQKDIAAAREAQQAMNSPKKNNKHILVDYDFFLEQHGEVGGDFVYAQGLQPHLTLFSVMDVCGKGLKAAQMAMAMGAYFRSIFKYLCKTSPESDFRSIQLAARLKILNRMLTRSTPSDMYASGVVLLLDTRRNVLLYFDFGHTPVYVIRNGKVHPLPRAEHNEADGFPFLGVDEQMIIRAAPVRVRSGDIFVATTDGVSETRNEKREELGEAGLARILGAQRHSSPAALAGYVKDALAVHRGNYRRLDDMTLLSFMVP